MSEATRTPGRPDWASGPLYGMLCNVFPKHRTASGVLDIQQLKRDLGKSHEAIYKCLRKSKITPAFARDIVDHVTASPPDHPGYVAPQFEDFCQFFL